MTTLRRFAAAGIAAVLLAGLSACASDSSDDAADTSSPTSSQPSDPTDSESSTPADEDSGGGPEDAGEQLSAANFQEALSKAQGNNQSAHLQASFDISAGGQAVQMVMEGDFASGKDPADAVMDMSVSIAGESIQMKLVDKSVFMKGAGMSTDPKKPWVKIDIDDPNSPFGSLYDSANPQSFTEYFAGAQSLKDLGDEKVDGVETHHYAVTVDTTKMLESNEQLAGMDPASLGFPKKLTIQAWLNDDEQPIKMVVPFGKLGSFEAHFSKYGEPVHVVAPPAKLVSSMGSTTG